MKLWAMSILHVALCARWQYLHIQKQDHFSAARVLLWKIEAKCSIYENRCSMMVQGIMDTLLWRQFYIYIFILKAKPVYLLLSRRGAFPWIVQTCIIHKKEYESNAVRKETLTASGLNVQEIVLIQTLTLPAISHPRYVMSTWIYKTQLKYQTRFWKLIRRKNKESWTNIPSRATVLLKCYHIWRACQTPSCHLLKLCRTSMTLRKRIDDRYPKPCTNLRLKKDILKSSCQIECFP